MADRVKEESEMNLKKITLIIAMVSLAGMILLSSGCAPGHVTVGVGVAVPGPWVGYPGTYPYPTPGVWVGYPGYYHIPVPFHPFL